MTIQTQTNKVEVQKIRTISSTVSDVERSLLFYTEAFSFKLVCDLTIETKKYSELQGIKMIVKVTILHIWKYSL